MAFRTLRQSFIGGALVLALLGGYGISQVAAAPTGQTATTLTLQADGHDFTVSGANFRANEPVFFWLNAPNNQIIATWLRNDVITARSVVQAQADRDGKALREIAAEFALADDRGTVRARLSTESIQLGFYGLVARGQASGITAVIAFEVRGNTAALQPTPATPQPTPAAGQAALTLQADGRNYSVNLANLRADEPVFYWLNTPARQVVRLWSRNGVFAAESVIQAQADRDRKTLRELASEWDAADNRGADRLRLSTESLAVGSYTLVARGHNSGITATATFDIR